MPGALSAARAVRRAHLFLLRNRREVDDSGDEERIVYWPSNEPFIHAVIDNITPSTYERRWYCMWLIVYNRTDQKFEPIKFHVPDYVAREYKIGDIYGAHFKNLGPVL